MKNTFFQNRRATTPCRLGQKGMCTSLANKGFTLVEAIVSLTVIGIITLCLYSGLTRVNEWAAVGAFTIVRT